MDLHKDVIYASNNNTYQCSLDQQTKTDALWCDQDLPKNTVANSGSSSSTAKAPPIMGMQAPTHLSLTTKGPPQAKGPPPSLVHRELSYPSGPPKAPNPCPPDIPTPISPNAGVWGNYTPNKYHDCRIGQPGIETSQASASSRMPPPATIPRQLSRPPPVPPPVSPPPTPPARPPSRPRPDFIRPKAPRQETRVHTECPNVAAWSHQEVDSHPLSCRFTSSGALTG